MAEPPAHETEAASPEPASRASFRPFLWVLLALFLLYPLSIGPVARFASNAPNFRHPRLLVAVYTPIRILCAHSRPVHKFFDWYINDLWGGPMGRQMKPSPTQ